MIKMKNSGYSMKFRIEVLKSAFNAFEKMLEDDKNGNKPLFRSREWQCEERLKSKQEKKNNWFKGKRGQIDYKTVLFVPPTPGGELAKEMQKREAELNKYKGDRINIVEEGGIKFENLITTKNPFKTLKCNEKLCPICKDTALKIPCNTNNCGYRWVCINCKDKNVEKIYEGETSRSLRVRANEHMKDLKNEKLTSALYKHKVLEHQNETVNYKFEVTGKFRDALTREANESVRISDRKTTQLLNCKSEFNHPPTARVVVEKKKIMSTQPKTNLNHKENN
eukprot:GFUD01063220.1.p1 GENE.GFUD01063220.1~~GFUD01063220.1.p1  ORF type:complete len:280 (-),score=59.98 GFUD01063220.1:2317-3156(-)